MNKKKTNPNQPKNSSYWMYGLIISIFIIFTYVGNSDNFNNTKKIMNLYDCLFLIIPWTIVFIVMYRSITSESVDLFEDVSKK